MLLNRGSQLKRIQIYCGKKYSIGGTADTSALYFRIRSRPFRGDRTKPPLIKNHRNDRRFGQSKHFENTARKQAEKCEI